MLSFFRRKKNETAAEKSAERGFSTEELAAAFPSAQPPEAGAPEPPAAPHQPADPARTTEPPVPPEVVAALHEIEAPLAQPAKAEPATQPIVPAQAAPAASVPAAATQAPAAQAPAAQAPVAFAPAPAPPMPAAAVTPATQPIAAPPVQTISAETEPVEPTDYIDKPAAPAGKLGWRERLRGSAFARSFGGLFSRNPRLDDDLLDEIETALITADVGVGATTALIENLRKRMKSREFADANALLAALRADLIAMLQPVAKPLVIDVNAKPFVLLTVGVNGVGKTTTIGKLAKRFRDEGRPLMLAAGDTFRAAAVAQLQAWGERNGVPVIAQGQNADAASVAFDALQAAKARGTQVLIADTAGRLHTQTGLMAELGKIRRVLGKVDPTAPHEVLMVIDGTTGQNALSQLRQFHAAVGVTGLVVTKLDGTAKGGVVFALAREFGIPIRFAGIGERPEDLRVFDAEAFVDALLPEALGG
ncbi:signal recognition particle-docking protein FtsY [Lysobacter capsici]|uniref:signal recognition particle-docking protein FtsY n=1 Tax=Lysobacter capsici TaxID=435897 RepID=UPI0007166864|nr:signal recognition particle-docking protein FtsY [Lysobacter capsici]ALN84992.1 signal recognition particle-docking protein FtsY [Lysobacter capsici]